MYPQDGLRPTDVAAMPVSKVLTSRPTDDTDVRGGWPVQFQSDASSQHFVVC